jgi:hypothetical protein
MYRNECTQGEKKRTYDQMILLAPFIDRTWGLRLLGMRVEALM